MEEAPLRLEVHPIHLGLGAVALPQPAFTGMAWYADYVARHGADGAEGRLVSLFHFTEPWDSWEMHPAGDEVVVCIAGEIILIQELTDGTERRIHLTPGEYAINPKGVWHTADTAGEVGAGGATALFITAGLGTEGRGR